METTSGAKVRRIAKAISRLPDRFAQAGLRPDRMRGWVWGQGAILVVKAFQAGAWGGPASVSPNESNEVVNIDAERIQRLTLAKNASHDERRAYVAKYLAPHCA